MKPRLTLSIALAASAFGAVLSGCSNSALRNSDNPEVVYNEAVRLIDDDRFLEATEFLGEVRRRFPQSRFAVLAELRAADAYFKQEAYTEAAAAYGSFVDLYPNHADAAYALYRKALSFYNDAPEDVARDQAPARSAAEAADQLAKRYPNSPLVKDAQELYVKSRLKLAQKEAYVARWYEKKDRHLAAFRRWKGLEIAYPDLKAQPDGQKLLAEAGARAAKLAEDRLTRDEQALPVTEEGSTEKKN